MYVDMRRMDDLLIGALPTAANMARAAKQIGNRATIEIGNPKGLLASIEVEVVAWAPSFGKSRWLVRDSAGRTETVAAERLKPDLPAGTDAAGLEADGTAVEGEDLASDAVEDLHAE